MNAAPEVAHLKVEVQMFFMVKLTQSFRHADLNNGLLKWIKAYNYYSYYQRVLNRNPEHTWCIRNPHSLQVCVPS